ncbi:MAG: response regulator [Gemmatimonadota bacterium]|nr:response regulator [Gemmatimonadota bacterium]
MRILVIDDEAKAAEQLARALTECGYQVDTAHGGRDGLEAASASNYDLVVSDIMMPGFDGFSIVHELRRIGRNTPVLFVTARHDLDARVRGLDLGADDYLIKPFALPELLARVRALLRRRAVPNILVYEADDLVLDLQSRRVTRGNQRIELTPKEFALLQFFLEHKGEVVSRVLIAQHVWDMDFDSGTNIIDVQIKRLRMKIEPPGAKPLIHTVRGVGYVLGDRAAPVSSGL